MKTKNNVQKTTLNSAVIATGLVILSLTVNAQDDITSLFENNGSTQIAMVMEKTNYHFNPSAVHARNLIDAGTFAVQLTKETEEPLQLEDWMTSETYFTAITTVDAGTERPLEIEDWMTIESNFNVNSVSMEAETSEELGLEDWMLDENYFNENQNNKIYPTSTFSFQNRFIDNELKVEDWMNNTKNWKE